MYIMKPDFNENFLLLGLFFFFLLFSLNFTTSEASLVAQLVKNPPVMQETPIQFLGQEDPLEKR